MEQVPRYWTMVYLALLTGLRIGEILALNWASVDFAVGQIRVVRGYYRGTNRNPRKMLNAMYLRDGAETNWIGVTNAHKNAQIVCIKPQPPGSRFGLHSGSYDCCGPKL